MKYENGTAKDVKIAYVGGGSRGWAWGLMSDLASAETMSGAVDLYDIEWLLKNRKNSLSLLKGNGDFRSAECIELLKEADTVVTNPPFSLFREYVAQLMEYEKKFLIIGPQNAITYKETFPLIRANKMWLGPSFPNGNAYFRVTNFDHREWANGVYNEETGLVKFRNVCWFTDLDTAKRHEFLTLYKQYSPTEYPKYDNYDAIEVSKTSDIPYDYDGVMGVPITFLDKYNPEQFEIIGATESEGRGFSCGLWNPISKIPQAVLKGKKKFKRLFIRHRRKS